MRTETVTPRSSSGIAAAAVGFALLQLSGAACGPGAGSGDPGGGSGGATAGGSGGSTATGSGGSTAAGSGGATTVGSGGATSAGSGGAAPTGTGGSTAAGSGGAAAGTGGATTTGSGGQPVAGRPEYWIAPNGLDTNPGTMAAPLQTLNAAHTHAAPGTNTTIWVMPGTYNFIAVVNLNKSGTATNTMKIYAMPGTRPVMDFMMQPRGNTSFRAINITGDYWHIRGIEIRNAADNCIAIHGSRNTVEDVVVHGCGDTGIQITVDSAMAGDATRGAYNTILNCDSYDNADTMTGGENADGFAAKLYIGPGNVFRGCRAWNNSDDGWDLFAANDVVTIDGCWAFLSGETSTGYQGPDADGNGFKLGGRPDSGDANMGGAVHVVRSSFAFDNNRCGFTRNNNPQTPMVTMSGERNNAGSSCITPSSPVTFTMTGAQAKAVQRNADGSLPAIR